MARRSSNRAGRFFSFLLGLLSGLGIGVVLGLLFAPHPGEITRREIRRKVEGAREQADETMEGIAS